MDAATVATIIMVGLFALDVILSQLFGRRAEFIEQLVYAIATSLATAWLIVLEMKEHRDALVGAIVLFTLVSVYFWLPIVRRSTLEDEIEEK